MIECVVGLQAELDDQLVFNWDVLEQCRIEVCVAGQIVIYLWSIPGPAQHRRFSGGGGGTCDPDTHPPPVYPHFHYVFRLPPLRPHLTPPPPTPPPPDT